MSRKQNAIYALTFVGALVAAVPAVASTTASSGAYGLKADVNVLNGTVSAIAAVAPVSGTAPDPYDKNATVASVNENVTLVDGLLLDVREHLGTGVIHSTASSGVPGSIDAASSVTIDGLGASFSTVALGALPLTSLGITARTITSTTAVGVGPGGLWSTGGSVLEGLSITGGLLGALNLDFDLLAHADPNTRIDLGAVSIIFNEQQVTGNGTSDIFRFTNALHIELSDYLLGGQLLNGDIIVGHSEASISGYEPGVTPGAVPEPATWAMMILGFGMVGAAARQRKATLAKVTA